MPDASGRPLPGEPGYAPKMTDPFAPQPGLINATPGLNTVTPGAPVVGYTPATATAVQSTGVGYTPNAYDVAPNQTVSSNIEGIIAKNSPLMTQAITGARQEAARRGLISSSIAVGAGQDALYKAALPIAQSDAATYAQAARDTVNAKNAEAQFRAGALNTASTTNAQLGTNTEQFNVGNTNTALGAAAAAANQTGLQTAQIMSQEKLGALQSNTQLNIADKQAATQKYLADNENSLRRDLASIESNTTLTVAEKQSRTQMAISAADNATRLALENIQSNTSLSIADKQALTQTLINERDNNTKLRLQDMQLQGDVQKIRETGLVNERLSRIDNNYRLLIQTSANAAEIYRQGMANAGAILTNPAITDREGALNIVMEQVDAALGQIGGISNLNLGETLRFGPPVPPTIDDGSGNQIPNPAYKPPVATTTGGAAAPTGVSPQVGATVPPTAAPAATGAGLGGAGTFTPAAAPVASVGDLRRGTPTVGNIALQPSIINPVNTAGTDPRSYAAPATLPIAQGGAPIAQTNTAIPPGSVDARNLAPADWAYYVSHPETWPMLSGDRQFISQMINAYGPGGQNYNADNRALAGYSGVFARR